MDGTVWRLPGPDRLVAQVTGEVQRGRHVAVVLPAQRAAEPSFVEGLLSAIVHTLRACGEEPRRPRPFEPGLSPLRWLAQCLVFGDELPAVVGDLLDHEDASARTAVLDCTGLDAPPPAAMADLLTRLTLASRPAPRPPARAWSSSAPATCSRCWARRPPTSPSRPSGGGAA
ncbi:hypothetical protein [Dactylosporangium darangshiense]|uniref:hypothetical protein n=1 Tax=Dactylosporangium darangshiense TaxID=579108 RepID=UPI0036280DEE